MDVWIITCLFLSFIFGIFAMVFALLKEKGAILISGFNTMPKKEREKYDKNKMSLDMRNSLFLWFAILLFGAILSYFSSNIFAIIAIVIWIVLLSKDLHFSPEKAFSKYKKQDL